LALKTVPRLPITFGKSADAGFSFFSRDSMASFKLIMSTSGLAGGAFPLRGTGGGTNVYGPGTTTGDGDGAGAEREGSGGGDGGVEGSDGGVEDSDGGVEDSGGKVIVVAAIE